MKKSFVIIAFGLAVGYVLGARAGRERYDEIVERANGIWQDPRLAKARLEAARYAKEQAPVIRDRAQAAAKTVADKTATAARDVADKTASAARTARDRTVAGATEVATRVGQARDDALEDALDGDEDGGANRA